MKKWQRFYFSGNQRWGWIEVREHWEFLVKHYANLEGRSYENTEASLLRARCEAPSVDSQWLGYDHTIRFGLYEEHTGPVTLREFFLRHGMLPAESAQDHLARLLTAFPGDMRGEPGDTRIGFRPEIIEIVESARAFLYPERKLSDWLEHATEGASRK